MDGFATKKEATTTEENERLVAELNRRKLYEERNYTWPPKIRPDTPGWKKLMIRRFRQLEFAKDKSHRWQGFSDVVISAY